MNEKDLIESSREVWERLETAVAFARRRGIARLDAEGLRTLHEDYRRTAADLAFAQTHFPGSSTERYLNRVVGEAHAEIYGETPHRLTAVWRFFSHGLPRLVRDRRRAVLLATSILVAATLLGFLLAYVNYPLARVFIPAQLRDGISDSIASGDEVSNLAAAFAPILSAAILVNNVQVSLLAFAGGMTFGALTAYALLVNGLMLGALAGVFHKAGAAIGFWSLIVPHGALELPAIALAAAAGFVLAEALIAPGDIPRGDALRRSAPDALKLLVGAAFLLVIAAFIEGFLTPAAIDPALKLLFGLVAFLALLAYLLLPRRGATLEASREGESRIPVAGAQRR